MIKNPTPGTVKETETVRLYKKTLAMNEQLLVSAVRQQELTEAAAQANAQLQKEIAEREHAEGEILRLNAQLEQRVAERTAQLEAANEELGAFSYSVSHDLRAPLRHVMGFVNLLKKDVETSLTEKSLRHLNTISESAKRMGTLIDDLLAFSRIGRSELQKAEVNLDQMIQGTLRDLETETKGRKIVWEIQPLPTVWADRALLRQVLVNLVSNAVKFTGARAEARIEIGRAPDGTGSPRATGGAEKTDPAAEVISRSETVIYVRDNGAGFNQDYAAKLFGVFQRLHSEAEFEGTGIGLALVQKIVTRHGGRIWAHAQRGEGATFYFTLEGEPAA